MALSLAFGAVFFLRAKTRTVTLLGSPLPSGLTLFMNNQVSTLDLWSPIIDAASLFFDNKPDLTATSVLAYDIDNSKTIFSKDPARKVPMASLTKIMTAIVALENPKKADLYIVQRNDLVGENSMGLTAGESLTLDELLHGLLLVSGNDAAESLSRYYENGRDGFVRAMNDKAKALGAKDTNFTNPTGLQGDGNQYTTAQDLLIITKYALENPTFAKIVSTYEYKIPATSIRRGYHLFNEINLLTTYPGVKGVKDGYTDEAGLCLITYLDYEGKRIIAILLGSQNRRQEMKDLLDYSLKSIGVEPPEHD